MGDDFRLPALAFEREASDRYREFQDWFVEHGLAELGALCARLASLHGEDGRRLACAGESLADARVAAARQPWIDSPPEQGGDDLFYGTATARQLIEIALAAETAAARGFDDIAQTQPDAQTHDLAVMLGASSRRCAGELAGAMQAAAPPDWEAIIADGGGPCLALGAERRLRRT